MHHNGADRRRGELMSGDLAVFVLISPVLGVAETISASNGSKSASAHELIPAVAVVTISPQLI